MQIEIETVYRVENDYKLYKSIEEAKVAAVEYSKKNFYNELHSARISHASMVQKAKCLLELKREAKSGKPIDKIWYQTNAGVNYLLKSKAVACEVPLPSYLNVKNRWHSPLIKRCVILYCTGMLHELNKLIKQYKHDIRLAQNKLSQLGKGVDIIFH